MSDRILRTTLITTLITALITSLTQLMVFMAGSLISQTNWKPWIHTRIGSYSFFENHCNEWMNEWILSTALITAGGLVRFLLSCPTPVYSLFTPSQSLPLLTKFCRIWCRPLQCIFYGRVEGYKRVSNPMSKAPPVVSGQRWFNIKTLRLFDWVCSHISDWGENLKRQLPPPTTTAASKILMGQIYGTRLGSKLMGPL
jgi:hypothetical protein